MPRLCLGLDSGRRSVSKCLYIGLAFFIASVSGSESFAFAFAVFLLLLFSLPKTTKCEVGVCWRRKKQEPRPHPMIMSQRKKLQRKREKSIPLQEDNGVEVESFFLSKYFLKTERRTPPRNRRRHQRKG